jgi:hypothetical protein
MIGESGAVRKSTGGPCRCRSRSGRFSRSLSLLCAAVFRLTIRLVAGITGAAAVAGIGVLSMGGGVPKKLWPVRCRAGGCLLLWQRHRLSEALNAADELGA